MIKRLIVGEYQTNCYILSINKQAIIIDPGSQFNKINKYIKENELKILAVFLTHGHIDHIGAVNSLVDLYQCNVYAHEEEQALLNNPILNLSNNFSPYVINHQVNFIKDQSEINIDQFKFIFHHMPGHTPGSCVIEWLNENILFSGDVLFKHSIGRYDLPLGNHHDTKKSLEKIKFLNPLLIVKPGHGDETILEEEILSNPFLN